jgi:hypothetical protein
VTDLEAAVRSELRNFMFEIIDENLIQEIMERLRENEVIKAHILLCAINEKVAKLARNQHKVGYIREEEND